MNIKKLFKKLIKIDGILRGLSADEKKLLEELYADYLESTHSSISVDFDWQNFTKNDGGKVDD